MKSFKDFLNESVTKINEGLISASKKRELEKQNQQTQLSVEAVRKEAVEKLKETKLVDVLKKTISVFEKDHDMKSRIDGPNNHDFMDVVGGYPSDKDIVWGSYSVELEGEMDIVMGVFVYPYAKKYQGNDIPSCPLKEWDGKSWGITAYVSGDDDSLIIDGKEYDFLSDGEGDQPLTPKAINMIKKKFELIAKAAS